MVGPPLNRGAGRRAWATKPYPQPAALERRRGLVCDEAFRVDEVDQLLQQLDERSPALSGALTAISRSAASPPLVRSTNRERSPDGLDDHLLGRVRHDLELLLGFVALPRRGHTMTSAEHPATSAASTSSCATPRKEMWSRSTAIEGQTSRPSAPRAAGRADGKQLFRAEEPRGSSSGAAQCPRAHGAPPGGRCECWSPSRCRARSRARRGVAQGAKPSPRSASVVGQRQTRAPASAIRSSSRSSACVAWTTVVRGPRQPVSASNSTGRSPCSSTHSSISRGCSQACTWSGSGVDAA